MTNHKDKVYQSFGVICRLCLKPEGSMSSIYANNEMEIDCQLNLANKISSIAQVEVDSNDGLPVSICDACRQQVDKFYDFRLQVEISDRTLRACLPKRIDGEKTFVQSDDSNDLDYEEYVLGDTVENENKNTYGENTLLEPSDNVLQVWKVLSVDDSPVETKDEPVNAETNLVIPENADKIVNVSAQLPTKVRRLAPELLSAELSSKEKVKKVTLRSKRRRKTTQRVSRDSEEKNNVDLTIKDVSRIKSEPKESILTIKYICQLCLKTFGDLRNLKRHVKNHFVQKCVRERVKLEVPYERCLIERLETMENNNKKEKIKDKLGRPAKKLHICNECGAIFDKQTQLQYHKGFHTESSLTCVTCNKKFANEQSFKIHQKRHEVGMRFICNDCGKCYYSKSELSRHVQTHTGTRQYPCEYCEMSFCSKSELTRHVKYHKGDKKFHCELCNKSYYESGHLKVHQRTHSGEKPFACDVCSKAFITKSKLTRHHKTHQTHRWWREG